MKGFGLIRRAIVIVTLCGFGLPQAEAIEIVGGPGPLAHMNDGLILKAQVGQGSVQRGGVRRGSAHRPVHRPPVHRPPVHRPPVHRPPVHRPPVHRPPVHRPPVHRPPVHRPPVHRPPVNRPPVHRPPVHRPPVHRPVHPIHRGGVWARPAWYRWSPGRAVAAGAAIGFVTAATAAAWAGAPPQSGLCWYYTDPARRQGFWDQCP